MQTEKGQSLIEVIFSVAVVVLVITGVVSLLVSSTSVKTTGFQRKTASDMAAVIVENLINQEKTNTQSFWQLNNLAAGQTLPNFSGYTYSVTYTLKNDGGCSNVINECANVSIVVTWGNNQTLMFNRFFSRKSN
jgi:Tfp pilus assembly protein PilV